MAQRVVFNHCAPLPCSLANCVPNSARPKAAAGRPPGPVRSPGRKTRCCVRPGRLKPSTGWVHCCPFCRLRSASRDACRSRQHVSTASVVVTNPLRSVASQAAWQIESRPGCGRLSGSRSLALARPRRPRGLTTSAFASPTVVKYRPHTRSTPCRRRSPPCQRRRGQSPPG